ERAAIRLFSFARTPELPLQALAGAQSVAASPLAIDYMAVGLSSGRASLRVVAVVLAGPAIRMAAVGIRAAGMGERIRPETRGQQGDDHGASHGTPPHSSEA